MLLTGIFVRFASLATIALMLVFIVMIAQVWYRGFSIDCGCFGGGGPVEPGTANYLPKLLRDLGLAVMGIYLFLFPQSKFALDKFATHETPDQKENKDEQ